MGFKSLTENVEKGGRVKSGATITGCGGGVWEVMGRSNRK